MPGEETLIEVLVRFNELVYGPAYQNVHSDEYYNLQQDVEKWVGTCTFCILKFGYILSKLANLKTPFNNISHHLDVFTRGTGVESIPIYTTTLTVGHKIQYKYDANI